MYLYGIECGCYDIAVTRYNMYSKCVYRDGVNVVCMIG